MGFVGRAVVKCSQRRFLEGNKGKFETSVERSERLLKGGLRYSGRSRDKLRSNEKKKMG